MKEVVVCCLLIPLAFATLELRLVPEGIESGAVCLDGTMPGYYIERPAKATTKWVLHIQGGGWCFDEQECAIRAKQGMGSSSRMANTSWCGGPMHNNQWGNPSFWDWNHVLLAYCDGASFSGEVSNPVKVGTQTIYFRGQRVLKAIIQHLTTSEGFNAATEVLFTGGSAGGLAVILQADYVASLMPKTVTKFKSYAQSGIFLSINNAEGIPVYSKQIQRLFNAQNISYSVNQNCLSYWKSTNEQWRCMFGEEAMRWVKTPLFIANSQYDEYSAMCLWAAEPVNPGTVMPGGNCSAIEYWKVCVNNGTACTADQLAKYDAGWGNSFRSVISTSPAMHKKGNGAFIHSCFIHLGESSWGWGEYLVNGVITRDAVYKWWMSPVTDPAESHTYIDCKYTQTGTVCCNPTCCIQH